ncbi:SDR family oxidoreductase [Staphylospora marina]|uniref:SDR family oxidoreductase n=1 Tax=Staphylospora marina TaxID=2490858 RepID=UPI001F1557CD|nr:SDR family oxidoreductase [Staphylospora marina]
MNRRIALVTGAGRRKGLGAAICRELAQDGVDIYFTWWSPYDRDIHTSDEREPLLLRDELRKTGVRVECGEWNLADPGAPAALMDEVRRTMGGPSILVNNACHSVPDRLDALTPELIDVNLAVNVRAPMLLCSEFFRRFDGEHGRIINIVSGSSLGPMPGEIVYAATKGTMELFTRHAFVEAGEKGITINAVNPGPTDTGWISPELADWLREKFALGRIGLPEDAAKLVRFLASPEAGWITGQVIHSEGGFTRR